MELDTAALKNFRDFLQLYNTLTETCFTRCVDNVNSRTLDQKEIECVEDCSSKFVKFNNKLMQTFVNVQTQIVNRRVAEAEKQNTLLAKNQSLDSVGENSNQNNIPMETLSMSEKNLLEDLHSTNSII